MIFTVLHSTDELRFNNRLSEAVITYEHSFKGLFPAALPLFMVHPQVTTALCS